MTMAKNSQKNKDFWLEDIVSSMANGRDENMKIPSGLMNYYSERMNKCSGYRRCTPYDLGYYGDFTG